MFTTWRQWCRLCAKEESNIDIFFKNENNLDLPEIINKHFGLSLSPLNAAPITICATCNQFLMVLAKFSERVAKVEAMYTSIVYENVSSVDYTTLKFQFGLVKEEPLPLQTNSVMNRCDQSTDTSGLVDEFSQTGEAVFVKEHPEKVEDMGDLFAIEAISGDDESDDDDDKESISINEMCVDYLEESGPIENSVEEDTNDAKSKVKIELSGAAATAATAIEKNPLAADTFQCDICQMEFNRKNRLRYHKRQKHPLEKIGFPCEKCSRKFPTEKQAKHHAMLHIEPNDKPEYNCSFCDKQFAKPTNLQAHIRSIHIGEKPFICEACGKAFATRGALKEHNFTHVDDTPYQCSACPKKFKTLPRLKVHEDIHNKTMYVCPNCGLILNTRRTLNMHMVVHSDQKKYKCNVCASEFKRAKALKNHLILHSGLRPYTCPFCDKTFANGSNCRSHKKKAHPLELAAMEAAGQSSRATNIPKLEQLKSS